MLISYDRLTREPAAVMAALYDFIGERRFEHDFERIAFSSDEYDTQIGLMGLHTVAPKVQQIAHERIVPSDITARFKSPAFWTSPHEPTKSVRLV